jgi:hypothetical protein
MICRAGQTSTNVTAGGSGNLLARTRYKPWGAPMQMFGLLACHF